MGLLDVFSDNNERQAADVVQKGYQSGYKKAKQELKGGFKGLKTDYAAAMDAISKGEGVANRALTSGQTAGTGAINQGLTDSTGAVTTARDASLANIQQGLGQSTGAITTARDAALMGFNPYARAGARGNAMLQNALGLKGAGGNAAAVSAFQAGPGYDWQMDQGMQALQRLNASRGRLDSGNTMIDAMKYSQGLANQEYAQWLDRLTGQQQLGYNVAGQTAGINTGAGQNLAQLYTGAAQNQANINTGAGNSLAGLYTGAGGALSNIYTGTGAALADVATGAGTQNAAINTGLGDARMGYGEKLADLGYATRLGKAGIEGSYLQGKDQTGMNAVGTITGGGNTGARLLGLV